MNQDNKTENRNQHTQLLPHHFHFKKKKINIEGKVASSTNDSGKLEFHIRRKTESFLSP